MMELLGAVISGVVMLAVFTASLALLAAIVLVLALVARRSQ